MARRILYRGDFWPTLEDALVEELALRKAQDPLCPSLVLCPTALLRSHLGRVCAERTGGLCAVRFETLERFVDRIGTEPLARRGLRPAPALAGEVATARLAASGLLEGSELAGPGATSGFASAAYQTLRDLREASVTPEELRGAVRLRPERGGRWSPLADLLAGLRCLFEEARWADDAQRSELAAERADSEPAKSVFLYGFYDLAARQWNLVRSLCASDRDVVAFVPAGDSAAFAFSARLQRAFELSGFRPAARACSAAPDLPQNLARLRERVLSRGPCEPLPPDGSFRIIATPSDAREAREVARAALDAARELGVPWREMAVLLHNSDDLWGPLGSAFDDAQIPTRGRPCRLSSQPGALAARLLLEWVSSGFSRAVLVELLTSDVLDLPRLLGAERARRIAPSSWDALTRRLGIVGGLGGLRARLRSHSDRLARSRRSSGPPPERDELDSAQSLLEIVEALAPGLETLPQRAPLGAYVKALAGAGALLVDDGGEAFARILASLQDLDPIAGDLDCSRVLRLVDRLGHDDLANPGPSGSVILSELMAARGVPFDLVIVPRLSERVFPRAVRGDPLLNDRDRRLLIDATGRPLGLKSHSSEEERMLFRLAVGAARRRLVLSYPRRGSGGGTSRPPSLYVLAALEAVKGAHVRGEELEREAWVDTVPLGRLEPTDSARLLDQRERLLFELRAAAAERNVRRVARVLGGYPHACEAIRLDSARWEHRTLTVYDGLLETPQARFAASRALDGPALSPSALELYAACPFRFLLSSVLKLERPEEPELEVSVDPKARGDLIHRILERLVAEEDPRMESEPVARARLVRTVCIELDRFEREESIGHPFLWRAERRRIEEDLTAWLDRLRSEDAGLRSLAVELAFGPASAASPVTLDVCGRRLQLEGRIDRVDLAKSGTDGLVIDYKTGRVPQGVSDDSLAGGRALQLAIYVMAARSLWPEVTRWSAMYDYVTARGGHARVRFDPGVNGERLELAGRAVECIARGIEGGLFIQDASGCRHCDFRIACGSAVEDLALRKLADDRGASLKELRSIE